MTPLTHIIWDWNGTLINDVDHALRALNCALSRRQLQPITLEFYREIYGHPSRLIYERAGIDLASDDIEALADEWHGDYLDGLDKVMLHLDTVTTLANARALRISQSILSALPHDILTSSVDRHNIRDYFMHVQGLEDRLGRSKVESAARLLANLGADPHSTAIIGDSTHDVEVASHLGLRCAVVARGFESRKRLDGHGVPVCESFDQALDAVTNGWWSHSVPR